MQRVVKTAATFLMQRAGTALAAYLTAKEVPTDVIGPFVTALGVTLALGADVATHIWLKHRGNR